MLRLFAVATAMLILATTASIAQDVRITPKMLDFSFSTNGKTHTISRNQNQSNVITGEFAKTSRKCPPFCVHPMSAGRGVETIGEIELLEFLKTKVAGGTGLLIDSRVPAWHEKGTIPGAINVPFSTLEPTNPYRDEILQALGALPDGDEWIFGDALELALFCNGPWCDQSPRAIRDLLSVGYPASKIKYYRGGMQNWQMLGLTVSNP